jgi:hypothetical protein
MRELFSVEIWEDRMKFPNTAPRVSADGWIKHFSAYTKTISGLFTMHVYWSLDREKPGYVVKVMDAQLKVCSPDVENGKRRAERFLAQQLKKGLAELALKS